MQPSKLAASRMFVIIKQFPVHVKKAVIPFIQHCYIHVLTLSSGGVHRGKVHAESWMNVTMYGWRITLTTLEQVSHTFEGYFRVVCVVTKQFIELIWNLTGAVQLFSTICAFILQVLNLPVMQLQNIKENFQSQEKGPKVKLRLQQMVCLYVSTLSTFTHKNMRRVCACVWGILWVNNFTRWKQPWREQF